MANKRGVSFPYGATQLKEGINFAVYAKNVSSMSLCLFNENDLNQPFTTISLDPNVNRTGDIWHILITDLPHSFVYGYQVTHQDTTSSQLLLDPYAKLISSDPVWHAESRQDLSYRPLGKFVLQEFDWEGDRPLNLSKKDLIIYEMHVRGFTAHPSSQTKNPGTFKGIMEKIPYLKEMGFNAVEFMPIQEFCEEDVILSHPKTKKKLHNYFGYSTVNYFSLMNRYASESSDAKAAHEFKTLVKELHKNGIEVILDVVFNHTFEGNEKGPEKSYKGFDPRAYYLINGDNNHLNFSGCGNTFNCNHPVALELIINALRFWVLEYHIDGFRFDLAAVFNRGKDGAPIENAPVLDFISNDPVLSATKLIAEPWDAAGLYQLGKFASFSSHWSEWNGKYQSAVRNFIKGTPQQKNIFAGALCGSHEIFAQSPYSSVNFVTAHDGFCLHDLVSYNHKHNEANGEDNKDGNNDNNSWNCDCEGPSHNKKVLQLRKKQMRNFHFALMISQGIPMLLMGDEYGHTKQGNNNPWCQDNELNWFLWDQIDKEKEFFHFFKNLIHFRKNNPLLRPETFLDEKKIKWHGHQPNQPNWEADDRLVAFTLHNEDESPEFYVAFNALQKHQKITVPSLNSGRAWRWVINTNNASPNDFYTEENVQILKDQSFNIPAYSSMMLRSVAS